jgi:cobalt-zinc-cadmium efflux system outer membrane protein
MSRTHLACATIATIAACFLCLNRAASASEPWADAPLPQELTLAWCLERAVDANPTLARARALAEASAHRAGAAGALDDPRFAYEASNLPIGDFDFESTPLSGHQLGLRQKIPFPGLLSSRKDAARYGAEAARLIALDQRRMIEGAVERAWSELAFAQQALAITDRNLALLRQLVATTEARYRVGSGLQQDVIRSQLERTLLQQERLRRVEARERAESALVALLDLPSATRLPPTAALALMVDTPDLDALLGALESESPRFQSAREQLEEARTQVRVAELEGLPDVDLGLGYRIRRSVPGDPVEGDDFLSAGVTLRLPVDRSKWRAHVAQRRSTLHGAEAELRRVRAELGNEVRMAHAELVRAASEETLVDTGLLPQARQSLAASRSAYEVGRIEFLSLLDSQVRLLEAELRLARARADKRRAFTALEMISGRKLR